MPRVVTLGTSAALPHDTREFTYLLVEGLSEAYLIDCAGSPLQRLLSARLPRHKLEGLLVTHHHPDHIYGVSVLLTGLWLDGRDRPFHIDGPTGSMAAIQAIGETHGWADWPEWLQIVYHPVEQRESAPVLETPEFLITGSPGMHLTVATMAIRVEAKATGGVFVYSSDTEPCSAIVHLARGADLLIHEATGEQPGHSSPAQAATVAQRAGVGKLVLVHYPRAEDSQGMLEEAATKFSGPVEVARDMASYDF